MKIITDQQYIPFGPYVTQMQIDPEFCKRLLEVGKTLTKKHNTFLAGELEHEYGYDLEKHPWIEEEFKVCVNTWIRGWRQFSGHPTFDPQFKLNPLWINFQKAGEYNPLHFHGGSSLSFVLFLEVPEEMLKEKNKSSGIPPGYLGFIYGEHSDAHCLITHRIIKPKVGSLLMFPSLLRHYATHFNSKVTRTSVSGNIRFSYKELVTQTKDIAK
jgi:hypothetical protein